MLNGGSMHTYKFPFQLRVWATAQWGGYHHFHMVTKAKNVYLLILFDFWKINSRCISWQWRQNMFATFSCVSVSWGVFTYFILPSSGLFSYSASTVWAYTCAHMIFHPEYEMKVTVFCAALNPYYFPSRKGNICKFPSYLLGYSHCI